MGRVPIQSLIGKSAIVQEVLLPLSASFRRSRTSGFVFLAIDKIPNHTDTTDTVPSSPPDNPRFETTMAIYPQADKRVGKWSNVVSIPVAGNYFSQELGHGFL